MNSENVTIDVTIARTKTDNIYLKKQQQLEKTPLFINEQHPY